MISQSMMKWCVWALLLLSMVGLVAMATGSNGCNKAICASVVSKCMLIKSCECDMTNKRNCTCCKDCHMCLAKHYLHCCSCVGMCDPPKANENIQRTSAIEDLNDPIPDLFNVLTEEDDILQRWSIHRYPVHDDSYIYKPHHVDMDFSTNMEQTDSDTVLNCTVAFMSQCMSLRKCKDSCKSMGAARYRWFHEHGCCQCIGNSCLDYGIGEEKCLRCPLPDGEQEEEDDLETVEAVDYENLIAGEAAMMENSMDFDEE
ncbi:twisted gastrulation protein homolog 1-like [Liolophura sinensis]|uniref:twisted gastrulation protein homolog 1-like n=1 Tax=Liolophura sinensis TaxID=3198878 RepID=UPI0031580FEF